MDLCLSSLVNEASRALFQKGKLVAYGTNTFSVYSSLAQHSVKSHSNVESGGFLAAGCCSYSYTGFLDRSGCICMAFVIAFRHSGVRYPTSKLVNGDNEGVSTVNRFIRIR